MSHSKFNILLLMARWPAPGRCKSRLSKDIGFLKASNIQHHLISHTISVAQQLEQDGLVETHLAVGGIGFKSARRWGKSFGIKKVLLQGEGTLGVRMRRQLMKINRTEKIDKAIIIGSDLPSLSRSDLNKALYHLNKQDLVIGPADDGGYWLLGLTGKLIKPIATWPFSGISWGSSNVLKETLDKAHHLGTKARLLNSKNDIDSLGDLLPWQTYNK